MDYHKILVAYMNHVAEQEGVFFLHGHSPLVSLTDAENAALFRAAAVTDCTPEFRKEMLIAADGLEA